MSLSPFSWIFLVLGMTVGIVDDSMLIASVFFFLAFLNEGLRMWASRPDPEQEERVYGL